jgi:hypothetical protein
MRLEALDELLRSRFHGASNITGIRFQLLYSLVRLFDLYTDPTAEKVQFEGLEDVDLKGLNIGNIYVQVKSSKKDQGWAWFRSERILEHFFAVFRLQPNARFVLATNFELTGQLQALVTFCNGRSASLPLDLRKKLTKIVAPVGFDHHHVHQFLTQVSFEYVSEYDLWSRLRQACVHHFDIQVNNEELYLSRLVECAIAWAADRAVVARWDIDAERLQIQDWISRGPVNPAVLSHYIEPLSFERAEMTADYYDAKDARPSHIAAGLDAPRPKWQRSIEEKFQRVQVCIVKAPSGQGKSTLLYRYALEHLAPNTIFRVNACASEEHAGQIVEYLTQRLSLGLPLLVLIDPLTERTQLWYRIAAQLAGQSVRFLVATREDDWYRYGQGTSAFACDMVTPELSLSEAQDIFHHFKQQGRVAPTVVSAEWAYARVEDRGLLIEFIYLITQGQMLAERIRDQIHSLQQEDPAKLDVLRLVATAHVYGARVRLEDLPQVACFPGDPDETLRSLKDEYLVYANGECEGLHAVRSQHLVRELHAVVSVEQTLRRLIHALDPVNLVALASRVFSDAHLQCGTLVETLVARCRTTPLTFINQIINALFLAGEAHYFEAHRQLFDAAMQRHGPSSIIMLTASTSPTENINLMQDLQKILPDNASIQHLSDLARQFRLRSAVGTQEPVRAFLRGILDGLVLDETSPHAEVAQLSEWCLFLQVPAPSLDDFLATSSWEAVLWNQDAETISLFLEALQHRSPARYNRHVKANREKFFRRFRQYSKTLTLVERGDTAHIEFIMDTNLGAASPNDQAVTRLKHLRRWFPIYATYCSQGLDPRTGGQPMDPDDTHKEMSATTLDNMLHASKNALYHRLVENYYAPLSVYEWIDHWKRVRQKMLAFARALIAAFEDLYRGQRPDSRSLTALGDEVLSLIAQAPTLPPRLADRFKRQEGDVKTWAGSFSSFVRQFFIHNMADRQSQTAFLMRMNLKEATTQLPTSHRAFADIFLVESDVLGMQSLDGQETEAYSHLMDVLDYSCKETPQPTNNLPQSIRQWHESRNASFAVRVRKILASLEQEGMTFLYPTRVIEEPAVTGVCIGFEIIDFEEMLTQVVLICNAFASSNLDSTFLYLVPTVNRQLCGSVVRMTFETLRSLFAGQPTNGNYPVEPPEGLTAVLPDLHLTPLPEPALVSQLVDLAAVLVTERNRLFFARSKLDSSKEEEAALITHYEHEVSSRIDEAGETFHRIRADALAYEGADAGAREWRTLWIEVGQYIEGLLDLSGISNTYIPNSALQHPLLQQMFHRYMNAKYRARN